MPQISSAIDASTLPSGASIAATSWNGFPIKIVCGYLDVLTAAQVTNFKANGLSVVYIWENTIGFGGTTGGTPRQSSYFTYQNGVKDANSAFGSFGSGMATVPANRPVYFTVDFDAGSGAVGGILNYFQGILDTTGDNTRIGIYAGAYILDYVKNNGLAFYFWQSESTGYINNAAQYPYAAMRQVFPGITIAGVPVDTDQVFIADVGQDPAPSISAPGSGTTSTAVAPSGGTSDASVNAVSSFDQPSSQSLITPATGHDQVIYSVTVSDAALTSSGSPQNAFYQIPTNIGQTAYPIGIFSYDGGATWNDFGFQQQVSPAFSAVNPPVVVQPLVDANGLIVFDGVNATGNPVNLIMSIALLATHNPSALTKPVFLDRANVSYTNQYQSIPPYIPPYSNYRRIDIDTVSGTGNHTVPHGQGQIPNILFWVSVNGFTTLNSVAWQSTGSTGALGIKMDGTNLTFHVDGGTYTDCYYRVYLDN